MQPDYPLDASKEIDFQHLEPLWRRVSSGLRESLGESTFELWFSDFALLGAGPEGVALSVPGSMYAIWVDENFREPLLSEFKKYLSACDRVRYEVAPDEGAEAVGAPDRAVPEDTGKAARVQATATAKVLVEEISEEKLLERGRAAGLVDIFRFDNFVPGENSELAWAAAMAVADQPGKTYQPLFFHSSCGLGKTHLLHGIGWESLRRRPKSKILFVTAEQFANEFIDAIHKNSLVAFRKKFREADLLLIDDVQFLGRREGLQQEFFHTFNRLADRRKQIVLASDCPASEINELEDRLVSRFQWGLSAEIHRPGLETRAAILRRKRDDWGMNIGDDVIDAIVERVLGNVRVLEGALIRIAMVSTMSDEPVRPEAVEEVLADICGCQETRQVGIEEIKSAVAEHYDVEVSTLNGRKRTARVAEARQVAMYLIRNLTDLSLVEIAASFGKDHGTVIYAVKRIKARCETSPSLRSSVELVKRKLVRGGGASADSARGGRRASDGDGRPPRLKGPGRKVASRSGA